MLDLLQENKEAIWWLALFSALVFVGSLATVPWLVVRIPEDYFATTHRPRSSFADQHPALRWTALIIKNVVGGLLVLAGIAMLVLPGQGLLTLAVGIMLTNFPGKHRLERKIIHMRPVRTPIDWLRRRAHVRPLKLEPDGSDD